MDSFLITARLNVRMFPGGYDYRSVEVEFNVAVHLIYMAAGLQTDILLVYTYMYTYIHLHVRI